MDINSIILIGFYIAILIYTIIIHEVAHGFVALRLGDSTAKYAGRLNFNPISHVDIWGSIMLPFTLILINAPFVFGWAKPVPYNPYNLKNQKWGPMMVALGGPGSNIFIALVFAIIANIITIPTTVKYAIINNFNNWDKIPELVSGSVGSIFFEISILIIVLNILLAVFNLIPIPPLDGSKILYAIFPIKEEVRATLEQYGFFFLLFILFIDMKSFHLFGSVLNFVWSIFLNIALR